jgi:signal transduction histidine kinase
VQRLYRRIVVADVAAGLKRQVVHVRDADRRSLWLDGGIVLALIASSEIAIWSGAVERGELDRPRALAAVLVVFLTLPLLWRRTAPVVTALLVLVALGALGDFPAFPAWVTFLIVFYSLGRYAADPLSPAVALALLAATVLHDLLVQDPEPITDLIGPWIMLTGAWAIGRTVRAQGREASRERERADRLVFEREERERQAVAEERARMARELHDVVAHSVSLITVQAQAVQRLLQGEERAAREGIGSIERVARQTATEMRRLLGILESQGDGTARDPQPGIAGLTTLVEQVRETGLEVELRIEGEPVPLAAGLDLSAYRIVQEALTNVLKHARASRVEVVVRYARERLELEVKDDGQGGDQHQGSGHGLTGMRERAVVFGGELTAGPLPGRGFRVRARLPMEHMPT